jgi:transposase InsO family protein
MEISRRKPILKNRVADQVEKAAIDMALEYPAYGQVRASNELRKMGIMVSSGGVHSIWKRNDLNTLDRRLKALEKKVVAEEIILTESQLQELEKQKSKREALGEIETEHSGFLGSQDTYYVGNFKGIGKAYQQTFVDTYSKLADAKLYTEKSAITAADMLNDRVVPFFDGQEIPLMRILTNRGTEYCRTLENHAFELFLSIEGIDHSKIRAYTPQTNGIREKFHKTMKNEFYLPLINQINWHTIKTLPTLITYMTIRRAKNTLAPDKVYALAAESSGKSIGLNLSLNP